MAMSGSTQRRLAPPRWIWATAAVCVAASLASQQVLDERVARWAHDRGLEANRLLQWATESGEAVWWIVGGAVVFLICAVGRRHNAARWVFALVVAVSASGLFVNLVKAILGRARPKLLFEEGVTGLHPFTGGYDFASMPSGHATTAGAVVATLALLAPRWRWPLLAAGAAVAATRVLIQAHYLGDVLLGFPVGMLFAHLTLAVWHRRWPASTPVPL